MTDKAPLAGNIRVTRQDWLNVAMDTLMSDGIEQVKILNLAERLSVSRSSFYWYFKSRQDLLDALMNQWLETNTKALVDAAARPAGSVAEAVCNIFEGFVDPAQFSNALDFAIRDWARRSVRVRKVLDTSDAQRVDAFAAMFARFGYDEIDSLTRARVLYYMQIGYNDADLREPPETRIALVPHYIKVFTGQAAPETVMQAFNAKMAQLLR